MEYGMKGKKKKRIGLGQVYTSGISPILAPYDTRGLVFHDDENMVNFLANLEKGIEESNRMSVTCHRSTANAKGTPTTITSEWADLKPEAQTARTLAGKAGRRAYHVAAPGSLRVHRAVPKTAPHESSGFILTNEEARALHGVLYNGMMGVWNYNPNGKIDVTVFRVNPTKKHPYYRYRLTVTLELPPNTTLMAA
jgi:hypothetical protein